ncbi:MAG: hypothetical protein ACI3ZL_02090 [Candidatus Cryptobacteroides sp.]
MELIFSLVILLVVTLLFGVVLLLCGGIAALFGVNFAFFMKCSSWLLLLPPIIFAYGVLIERNYFKVNNSNQQLNCCD